MFTTTLYKLPFGIFQQSLPVQPTKSCLAQIGSSKTANMPQSIFQLLPGRGTPSQRGLSFLAFVNELPGFKRKTGAALYWLLVAARAGWFQRLHSHWFLVFTITSCNHHRSNIGASITSQISRAFHSKHKSFSMLFRSHNSFWDCVVVAISENQHSFVSELGNVCLHIHVHSHL